MSDRYAPLPKPPYYAAIFAARRGQDVTGYDEMAERMGALAAAQPGFLGIEYSADSEGFEITVSYWKNKRAIAAWKAHAEHQIAQETGKARWLAGYVIRIAKVERAYRHGDAAG
jgi:heme-degrading monooxygenase HmoA